MKHRQISATEFKAKCLALLDDLRQGDTITITKRGKPVGVLQPSQASKPKSYRGCLAGKIKITGDLANYKALPLEDWEAFTNPELIMYPERRGKQRKAS